MLLYKNQVQDTAGIFFFSWRACVFSCTAIMMYVSSVDIIMFEEHMYLLCGSIDTRVTCVCSRLVYIIKSDLHCVSVSVNTKKYYACSIWCTYDYLRCTVHFLLVQTDCSPLCFPWRTTPWHHSRHIFSALHVSVCTSFIYACGRGSSSLGGLI